VDVPYRISGRIGRRTATESQDSVTAETDESMAKVIQLKIALPAKRPEYGSKRYNSRQHYYPNDQMAEGEAVTRRRIWPG